MFKLWHTCNARWIWNDRDPGSGRNDTRPAPADSAMLTKAGSRRNNLESGRVHQRLGVP